MFRKLISKTLAEVSDVEERTVEITENEPTLTEEWIWVEGYKGTDRDMKCRDFQYELGKQYDMPENEVVEECVSGFHMCLELNDVFGYYKIQNSNRFFKVKALVRKSDVDSYGKSMGLYYGVLDKLAAKSIEFIRELTIDEIFEDTPCKDWPDNYKKLAIEIGTDKATIKKDTDNLVELGFSNKLATYITSNYGYNFIKKAKAIASQPDLSMDVKCMLIFSNVNKG